MCGSRTQNDSAKWKQNCLHCVALELLQLLMEYEVRGAILEGLVQLLRPTSDDVKQQLNTLSGQCIFRRSIVYILTVVLPGCVASRPVIG